MAGQLYAGAERRREAPLRSAANSELRIGVTLFNDLSEPRRARSTGAALDRALLSIQRFGSSSGSHEPKSLTEVVRRGVPSAGEKKLLNLQLVSFLALVVACAALLRAWRDHLDARRRIVRLEDQLRQHQKLLTQRAALAGEIAHEIKNPLTAILCSAETLDHLLAPRLEPEHREALHYIVEYGDELLRLVSDFLDITRAESQAVRPQPVAVEVLPLVHSVRGLLTSMAQRKRIKVVVHAEVEALWAEVDPRHLKQVTFNLLHNALKFTPRGGEVRVELRQSAACAVLQIADTGPGLRPERISTLFDPYHSISAEGQNGELGTGLGLGLAKTLLELNHGSITVQSELGRGSCFTISLPLAAPVSGVRGPSRPQPGVLEGRRVLLVESDPAARESLARLMETLGAAVEQVDDAARALTVLARGPFDTVLLDERAHAFGAGELSRQLRQLCAPHTTIVVTGASEAPDSEGTAATGPVDRFIEKPLDGRKLIEALQRSL